MVSFAVSKVELSGARYPAATAAESLGLHLRRRVEDSACNLDGLVLRQRQHAPAHPMIGAVHTAFEEHHPLVLSPDDVWLCIAQGLAYHIQSNAEDLRGRFVRHAGRATLTIRRDKFLPGAPGNDWAGVFAELSDQIAQHIGKQRDLVVAQFSTTGPIERAASEVVLLAAMQSYFEVHMYTMCGIPSVTLLGTVEDWQSIRRRAEMLGEYGAREWQQALLPVLDQLVSSARGKPDIGFWESIYKLNSSSGGPYITGWLNVLFPYLTSKQDRAGEEVAPKFNGYMTRWQEDDSPFGGARFAAFPGGMMQTPFRWFTLTGELAMSFAGGFCGISQDAATGALRPAIGWAVTQA